MSTQRFMSRICASPGRFTFAMVLGVVLALPCLLPMAAFADTGGQTGVLARSSTPDASTALRNKTGVSVVRIVADYTNQVSCTGLGVLVSSQPEPGAAKTYQNWVLTDGNLVSGQIKECGKSGQGDSLNTIQIWPSSGYTGIDSNGNPSSFDQLNCKSVVMVASCSDGLGGPNAPANIVVSPMTIDSSLYTLFPFESTFEEPYVGLGATGSAMNIALVKSGSAIYPSKNITAQSNFKEYLTPAVVPDPPGSSANATSSVSAANMIEGGTPQMNAQGEIVGIWLNNGQGDVVSVEAAKLGDIWRIGGFPLTSPTAVAGQPCTVAACWNSGMDAYNSGNNKDAQTFLNQAHVLNPQFTAAADFASLAKQNLAAISAPRGNGNGNSLAPVESSPVSSLLENQMLLLVVGIVVVVLLLALIVLVIRMRRRRRILAEMAAEFKEAQRRAAEQAIQRQREAQQAQAPQAPCPNCRQLVHLTDTMCPYCRFPLAPTASGMGVRLIGNAPLGSAPLPPLQSPISEQPTQMIAPPPSAPLTADFGDTTMKPQSFIAHEDVTQEVQQLHGRNLSLAVGTLSDPGIKRKHKPNEDSLFAMQGARTHNSQPQQFGLFVVADGMGGHANGQDASRLAIQTITDFMLPRIFNGEVMDDEAFLKLMGEGVQASNQAVHNRNMEAHADMGTTMTAALVVGATAYVANVGDSRTYLYREGQGLSKVTHDHSVVASLVEAGIIKPDDIYTHPKRNQIYRSLGEKPIVEVDTFRVNLLPGDKLLLCSDGLWDMVRDPLIHDVLGKTTVDPNETGKNLIKAALAGGGEDNVSVIVVQFAEMNEHTGMTGVQLLAKPETVTVPNLPPLAL